jgi:hypothetical protein
MNKYKTMWTDDGSSGELGPVRRYPGGTGVIVVPAEEGLGSMTITVTVHGGVIPSPVTQKTFDRVANEVVTAIRSNIV